MNAEAFLRCDRLIHTSHLCLAPQLLTPSSPFVMPTAHLLLFDDVQAGTNLSLGMKSSAGVMEWGRIEGTCRRWLVSTPVTIEVQNGGSGRAGGAEGGWEAGAGGEAGAVGCYTLHTPESRAVVAAAVARSRPQV